MICLQAIPDEPIINNNTVFLTVEKKVLQNMPDMLSAVCIKRATNKISW